MSAQKHEDVYNPIKDEIERRIREDSRLNDWRPFDIETRVSDGAPYSTPVVYILGGSSEPPEQFSSNEMHHQFQVTIRYINRHRDLTAAQDEAEKVHNVIQDVFGQNVSDMHLEDENGDNLANGPQGLSVGQGEHGAFTDESGDSWLAAEVPLNISCLRGL